MATKVGVPLIFPRAALDQGAITQLRRDANVIVQGIARGTNSVEALICRNFRPTDTTTNGGTTVGHLVNPVALLADTYALDVFPNCTTKQTQAFAIYGIELLNATPLLDEVTLRVGSQVVCRLPLGELQSPGAGNTPQIGYFSQAVWVPPTTHLSVDLLSGSGQTISLERFNLIGYVAEKASDNTSGQNIRDPKEYLND